ncbi:MAG: hypothetical protein IJ532_06050 [Alphaproteobacteria bacterium]|nr:hypothetical protein [Alphaproteobacteria bacterium]
MNLISKFIASGLAFGIVLASTTAVKADEATSRGDGIIFRIENIKPLVNEEGVTSQCEFYVTVYNRMDKEVKEAELSLSWTDNISSKYKFADNKLQIEEDAKKAKFVVSKTVALKNITPHQQKSFKEVVDTDKCFLLFDRVDYKITTCYADGDEIKMKNNKRTGNGSCTGKFDYINSQNPEYYSEFKDIPESSLQEMVQEQDKANTNAIDDLYKSTIENMDKITKNLHKIR